MKTRRMLAITMALALTAGLAGCGSSSSSTETTAAETEAGTEAVESTAAETAEAEDTSAAEETQAAEGTVYKVGIVQYVDDASLNQIEQAIEDELDAKGAELGVTFDYADYTYNGQADSTTMNQIATDLIAEEVDIIIPIATPTALIMQAATEDNQIPVVFSAVSDPVGSGVVASMEEPGSNITGTSDALDTEAIMELIVAADPDITTLGLLYDKGQDSSTQAIADAKAYCEENGIEVVEKTGTTNDEVMLAADALIAAVLDAVFNPYDITVKTADLSIYEKFIDAKIPHYTGANSFALNGAFCGYGTDYELLGTETADMAVEILVDGADPATMEVRIMSTGIATINTETAEAIGLDYSMFESMVTELIETVTAEEFE
ncbi:MAG: ABC transporter substrate-binding protein [Lachnospiraceae bacterium]|nr:ABC transporter substrate-binding protein [Lachnospiraceae bacterium]